MANKVKAKGGINLAQGIPAFDPPEELLHLLSKAAFEKIHQYAPGKGIASLLQQLALNYNICQDNFLVVNGATEAISTIFTYLLKENPGSAVLTFSPAYESYKHLPRLFNVPFYTQAIASKINFSSFEKQCSDNNIKIVLLASPGNPLGRIFTKAEIINIIEITKRHNAYVIIDAVYSDLYFEDKPYYPINNISENVFYVNAFSKKLSITGWRIGYLLSHEKHMAALMDVHDYIGLSSPSVLQHALAEYLRVSNFGKDYCSELRANLKTNYYQMKHALIELGFKVIDGQGGYFIWAKLPVKFTSGFDFAIELYEQQKVAIVPGIHFDETGEQYIRLNIARYPYEIDMAIEKIKNFINT